MISDLFLYVHNIRLNIRLLLVNKQKPFFNSNM